MLTSYFELRPYLSMDAFMAAEGVADMLPTEAQDMALRQLLEDLKKPDSVATGLQRADLFDARAALNWLAEKYPQMAPKIGPSCCEAEWRAFERGAAKVQGGQESQLTQEEAAALDPFLINPLDAVAPSGSEGLEEENFDAVIKKARLGVPVQLTTSYINLSFLKADVKVIERLFSCTQQLWREGRKEMTPAKAELLLFLKCNRDLWGPDLVLKCLHSPRPRHPHPDLVGAMVASSGGEEGPWGEAAAASKPFVPLGLPTVGGIGDSMGDGMGDMMGGGMGGSGYLWSFCTTGLDADLWDDKDEAGFMRRY